jgi:L-lactate dehydrogenase complex protein LldG
MSMDTSDAKRLISMNRIFKTVKDRQKKNRCKIPDLDERVNRLKKVRESSVGNSELLKTVIESLESNGFRVRFAEDGDSAVEIVLEEIGDSELVVKSKSNLTKEISLTDKLVERGVEVVETDIGDRLIQLLGEEPSHPTGPASHLSVEEIYHKLKRIRNDLDRTPYDIINFLLEDIKESISRARVGVTGANAITAEGSILILHNEGNIHEIIRGSEKLIVVVGIDKIYPDLEEAINSAKIQSFYATGNPVPSFIEVISGVSKTADIEKRLYKGIHNPREAVVVVVDNGRSYLIRNGFKELFYCIGCGNCVINCPAYSVHGKEFKGGRFALYHALYNNNSDLKLCLSCKRCKKSCPVGVDIPSMISRVREGNELYNFLYSHARWIVKSFYLSTLSLWLKVGGVFVNEDNEGNERSEESCGGKGGGS